MLYAVFVEEKIFDLDRAGFLVAAHGGYVEDGAIDIIAARIASRLGRRKGRKYEQA